MPCHQSDASIIPANENDMVSRKYLDNSRVCKQWRAMITLTAVGRLCSSVMTSVGVGGGGGGAG